jgi:hypothetical protein
MTISREDIANHRKRGPWRALEARARLLAENARRHGGQSFDPVLGGGTRLMLALNHRISDDIDLFINSPGWLPYLSPRLNDIFDNELSGYQEDGDHVKLQFPEGEIDFIVRAPLLSTWIPASDLWNPGALETVFPLEPPAEVLAKKLFHRGWALTARDLFDWRVLTHLAPKGAIPLEVMATLLASRLNDIDTALGAMTGNEFQRQKWLEIRTPFIDMPSLREAAAWGHAQTKHLRRLAAEHPATPAFKQSAKTRHPTP